MRKLIVAIDGPAGAGKSTVAKLLAQRLGYTYIDTGAMYRAVTWEVMRRHLTATEVDGVVETARSLNLRLDYIDGKTVVHVDDINITEDIRSPEVSRLVAEVSKIGGVRAAMVSLQRQLASFGGVVMDGRDIGTHVLPNADIKIFLTASIEERARRRWLELCDRGYAVDITELQQEIAARDKADCERDIAPLIQAADATYLDTTALTIPQAVDKILGISEAKASVL